MPQRYGTSRISGPARLYNISSVNGTNCFIAIAKTRCGGCIAAGLCAIRMTAAGRISGNVSDSCANFRIA